MKFYRQYKTSGLWRYGSYLIAAIVLFPLATVVLSWLLPISDHWEHLRQTLLFELVVNSILLTTLVAGGSATLGVSLAWITSQIDFPGRELFRKGLLLPLAIPSYVTGFVYLGLLDYAGPVFVGLRALGFADSFFDIRGIVGASIVLTFGLFPYVYLLSRQAFESQSASLIEAARSLGVPYRKVFLKLAVPMAWPWIFGALCLVAMETLADFGTVSIFGVNTFTTAIYKAWYGFFSPTTAAQLSSGLLLFIVSVLYLESKARQGKSYSGAPRGCQRVKPRKEWLKWVASGYCLVIFSLAFVVPILQLGYWAYLRWEQDILNLWPLAMKSLVLGLLASLLICVLSLVLVFAKRFFPIPKVIWANRIAILGYALPGSVLAVGVFLPLVKIDHLLADIIQKVTGEDAGLIFTGTLLTVLIGLAIRFMAVGHAAISAGLERVSPRIDEAAINYGVYGLKQMVVIHLPNIWKSVLGASVLVFIDVIKEMPLTLMTRPFGWDTLAVRIFELISEGEWEMASLPALLLAALGLVPVLMMKKESH